MPCQYNNESEAGGVRTTEFPPTRFSHIQRADGVPSRPGAPRPQWLYLGKCGRPHFPNLLPTRRFEGSSRMRRRICGVSECRHEGDGYPRKQARPIVFQFPFLNKSVFADRHEFLDRLIPFPTKLPVGYKVSVAALRSISGIRRNADRHPSGTLIEVDSKPAPLKNQNPRVRRPNSFPRLTCRPPAVDASPCARRLVDAPPEQMNLRSFLLRNQNPAA